jgi:hypothetical protein
LGCLSKIFNVFFKATIIPFPHHFIFNFLKKTKMNK